LCVKRELEEPILEGPEASVFCSSSLRKDSDRNVVRQVGFALLHHLADLERGREGKRSREGGRMSFSCSSPLLYI
jgi:hypothetical protein